MPGQVGMCPLWGLVTVPSHPSLPTRLTAFVLKVLSVAQEQVGGSPEKLQETARWLLTQQQADGSFQDPCPVLHRAMQVRGWEAGQRSPGGRALPAPPCSWLTSSFLPPSTRGVWWEMTRMWRSQPLWSSPFSMVWPSCRMTLQSS